LSLRTAQKGPKSHNSKNRNFRYLTAGKGI
jgi:hypothetical protein